MYISCYLLQETSDVYPLQNVRIKYIHKYIISGWLHWILHSSQNISKKDNLIYTANINKHVELILASLSNCMVLFLIVDCIL